MGSVASARAEDCLDQPSVEEKRALIDRIAGSAQFRRSVRLRDFLLYVGGQSLKDGCPEMHEPEIGAKVFGRPSAYDRSQDNIVRVNATELRKRIELYFASEGAHEKLILEIPRGGYMPVFHRRSPGLPSGQALFTENFQPGDAAHQIIASAPTVRERRTYPLHLGWASLSRSPGYWYFSRPARCVSCCMRGKASRRLRPFGELPSPSYTNRRRSARRIARYPRRIDRTSYIAVRLHQSPVYE